jgi:hypothetical protein
MSEVDYVRSMLRHHPRGAASVYLAESETMMTIHRSKSSKSSKSRELVI